MKMSRGLRLAFAFFLFACQPHTPPAVTIIDNNKTKTLQTDERIVSEALNQAGIKLHPNDRVLLNGLPVSIDQPITTYPVTIQIRHAVGLTLITPNGEQKLQSSAFTVGEALGEASYWLRAGNEIEPDLDAPITDGMKVTVTAPRELTIGVDGKTLQIQSSARTVGEALAKAGIPLLGLDYTLPAESDPLPSDGQIRVIRVTESVLLTQNSIPFENDFQ